MIVSQGFYPIRDRSRLVAKFKEKIEQVMISEAFMHYPQDFVSILLFILLLFIHSFLLIKHDNYLQKKKKKEKTFHTQFSDKSLLL